MKRATGAKKDKADQNQPFPPDDWTRCHAYVERKRRFCRQSISPLVPYDIGTTPIYCGNHQHLYSLMMQSTRADDQSPNEPTESMGKKRKKTSLGNMHGRKRIPCPIDPSHTIYEDRIEQHVLVCPRSKQRCSERDEPYYVHKINSGGFGRLERNGTTQTERDKGRWARRFALDVLRAYDKLFVRAGAAPNDDRHYGDEVYLKSLSSTTMYDSIPQLDLSQRELDGGLGESVAANRVKVGGEKHLRQQGSIVGHLRRVNLIHPLSQRHGKEGKEEGEDTEDVSVIEMGAGRGMLGLVVAGVISARIKSGGITPDGGGGDGKKNGSEVVNLIMVERAGSRSKADTKIRMAKKAARLGDDAVEGRTSAHSGKKIELSVSDGMVDCLKSPKAEASMSVDDNSGIGKESTKQDEPRGPYLRLDHIELKRIKCDLAHVHMPSVMEPDKFAGQRGTMKEADATSRDTPHSVIAVATDNEVLMSEGKLHDEGNKPLGKKLPRIAVAKHLCGAGTDLALKSLRDVSGMIEGCVMATCCHGLCSWDDYIGRDYLRQLFEGEHNGSIEPPGIGKNDADSFGREEFDLMRRWSSGSVVPEDDGSDEGAAVKGGGMETVDGMDGDVLTSRPPSGPTNDENDEEAQHEVITEDKSDSCGISSVVHDLKLGCGVQGLGRACQRLIDYGRCEYMKHELFQPRLTPVGHATVQTGASSHGGTICTEMCHYVDQKVTPQNALLLCYRCR